MDDLFTMLVHWRKRCALTFSTAVLVIGSALYAPVVQAQPELARRADDFVDSIGVNTHLFYDNSVYYQKYNSIIKPKLLDLGVRHIRDGGTLNRNGYLYRLKELASLGIRSTLIFDPRDSTPQQAYSLLKELGVGVVEAVEGPNEYDNSGDSNWVNTVRTYQHSLNQALLSDSATALLPELGPTFTSVAAYKATGDLGAEVDYDSMHNYYSGRNPGTGGWVTTNPDIMVKPSLALTSRHTTGVLFQGLTIMSEFFLGGDNGYGSITWNVQLAQKYMGDKPVISTETGYHNTVNTTDIGVPEDVAGKYIPRLCLEQFNYGIPGTFLYELINVYDDPNDPQKNFGLLRNDGSEKPAFIALKNLISLLKDPGSEFTLGALNYRLSGNMTNVHHTLLQKHDGTFYLILWQEVSGFDVNSTSNINVANHQVKLTLLQPIQSAVIYLPNNSINPLEQDSNPNQINLNIADYPLVVELKK